MADLPAPISRFVLDRDELPERESLPWYVAPVPRVIENLGLRLAWLVVLANLGGTLFGFWYYRHQFGREPVSMYPFVPDSPMATLFIALSVLAWLVGRNNEYLNALAFFGCIKLGAWTPYVLLAFNDSFSYLHPVMYNFLFWSHLAMVVEAFVIYRYSDFPVSAVSVAVTWYLLNDLVDYFVPIVGDAHHTTIPAEAVDGAIDHSLHAHDVAAAGAVVLTVSITFFALATRVKKLELRQSD